MYNNKKNIDKIVNADEAEAKTPLQAAPVGAYSAGSNLAANLTPDAWEAGKNKAEPWGATPQGRLAIRTFSRGVMGAAFFTAGGLLAKRWMRGESRPGALDALYNENAGLLEQKNPLQFIAKLVDTVAGKPIEAAVSALGGDGVGAVRFRPTMWTSASNGLRGRSLGEEVVMITFDFFAASIGDAFGRDIAGWIDPNVKKSWMKDGRIDVPEAVQSAMKSTFRYVAYNGGEDWAVAIPYAYYMKAQRKLIDKISPGFRYDFDRSLNGASFKINDKGQITGNYSLEGAMDLQGRFTVYNIGTLMYREAYNYIADRLAGKPSALYGAPDRQVEARGAIGQAAHLLKWAARSTVKALITMTPSVPFFWITRATQGKHRGLAIHPEKGMMAYQDNGRWQALHANELAHGDYKEGNPLYFSNHYNASAGSNGIFREAVAGSNPFPKDFDPYAQTFGAFDAAHNAAGRLNRKLALASDRNLTPWLDRNLGRFEKRAFQLPMDRQGNMSSFSRFVHPFVNASVAYTPYMYMKAETANLWDDGKMDLAAERLIDGASGLNWGEFKAGAHEVWNSIWQKPLSDPAREKEAQCRIELDSSPADVFTQNKQGAALQGCGSTRFADKIEPKAARTPSADGLPHAQRIRHEEQVGSGPEKRAIAKALPAEYTKREDLRAALEDMKPPTASVH